MVGEVFGQNPPCLVLTLGRIAVVRYGYAVKGQGLVQGAVQCFQKKLRPVESWNDDLRCRELTGLHIRFQDQIFIYLRTSICLTVPRWRDIQNG